MRAFFILTILVNFCLSALAGNGTELNYKFPINKNNITTKTKLKPEFRVRAPKENPIVPSFYFSWGYCKNWYSKSDVHIVQPSLNCNYTMSNISAHDYVGWDHLFQHQITVPQYSCRMGWFSKKDPTIGYEITYDHPKFKATTGSSVHQTGTFNGAPIDRYITVNDTNFFWKLNNGVNFWAFNLMKRFRNFSCYNGNLELYTTFKGGLGPNTPHVEDVLFGMPNKPHFQLGGVNAQVTANLRLVFWKHVYIDLDQKLVYARYFRLRVYEGLASQNFWTHTVAGSLGLTFNLNRKPKDGNVQNGQPPIN